MGPQCRIQRNASGRARTDVCKGVRPKAQEHHLAVVSFVEAVYVAKFSDDLIKSFSKARLRRNESLYDQAGIISEKQSRNLVDKAEAFVNISKELLKA